MANNDPQLAFEHLLSSPTTYSREDVEIIGALLEKGAEIQTTASDGWTALHKAASKGKDEAVQFLLEKGASVEAKTNHGLTALHCAAENYHKRVVLLLLDKGANINAKTGRHLTPLHRAIKHGCHPVVQLLLERGANVNVINTSGWTPLHTASSFGRREAVELLLDNGATIETKDVTTQTALHQAANRGRTDIVQVLLDNHANIEARTRDNWTPLHIAAKEGREAVVRQLLDNNADIEAATKTNKMPLNLAAWKGHEAVVRLLLERSAKITTKDDGGWTPLLAAADNGHTAVVVLLLENLAPIEDATHKYNRTGLYIAAERGYEEVAQVLLNNHANVKALSSSDQTPLHAAAYHGHEGVVKLLLENGGDPNAKDLKKETPLSIAKQRGHKRVVTLLSGLDPAKQDIESRIEPEPEELKPIPTLLSSNLDGKWTPQFWLERIDKINQDLKKLANSNPGVSPVKIAILDTGCNLDAQFFSFDTGDEERLKDHWKDWVEDASNPKDEDGHGTALVTLLLRVVRNAEVFVARVAKNAKGLQDSQENIANAIEHAAEKWNVDIISMSFGFPTEVESIKAAITNAERIKNYAIVFFAAAANDGANAQEMFPAYMESVISVRGTNFNGRFVGSYDPPPTSQNEDSRLYGTLGEDVPYDWATEETKSGCSLATPIMAGITALVLQYFNYILTGVQDSAYIQKRLRTRRGVLQLFKEIAVPQGTQRYYVAPWALFEKEEQEQIAIVRVAIGKLPR